MKSAVTIVMAFVFCLSAHSEGTAANSHDEFPITVVCKDDKNYLSVGLNMQENTAHLYLDKEGQANPLHMSVHKVAGMHSYSSVALTSTTTGSPFEETTMVINAQMVQNLRVSTTALFSLSLTQIDGVTKAQQLSYESGIDAFPDTQVQDTIDFNNLTCSITGL